MKSGAWNRKVDVRGRGFDFGLVPNIKSEKVGFAAHCVVGSSESGCCRFSISSSSIETLVCNKMSSYVRTLIFLFLLRVYIKHMLGISISQEVFWEG